MNPLDKLIAQFEQFPGIGARQAKRFAFHVLNMPVETTNELAELITSIHSTVTECAHCKRYFAKNSDEEILCTICADPRRDISKLL
ncbi:MAG: recombination protein RecR, partial [Candidatus Paceibacterota bacterium]